MNVKIMMFSDMIHFSLIVGCQYFVVEDLSTLYIDSSVLKNVGACLPEYSASHTGRLFIMCRHN